MNNDNNNNNNNNMSPASRDGFGSVRFVSEMF